MGVEQEREVLNSKKNLVARSDENTEYQEKFHASLQNFFLCKCQSKHISTEIEYATFFSYHFYL